MSGLRANTATAKTLIRLRIILAGEGTVREDFGAFRATLPGDDGIVEVDDRVGTGSFVNSPMHPHTAGVDLNSEGGFVDFMDDVDATLARRSGLPTTLFALADEYARVCAEGDAGLASIVSLSNLQLERRAGTWEPAAAFKALVAAASDSEDERLADVAFSASRDPDDAPDFDADRSRRRWCDLVERWSNPNGRSYPAGPSTWVEVKKRVGVGSVAEQVSSDVAEVLSRSTGDGKPTRLSLEAVAVFALYDEAGYVMQVATVDEDDIHVVRKPDEEHDETALDALRDGLGLSGPTIRP